MNVSETCSCGATFSAEGDNVIRLLREWRREHVCKAPDAPENDVNVMTSADTKTEILGFQARSLTVELPDKPGWGDE